MMYGRYRARKVARGTNESQARFSRKLCICTPSDFCLSRYFAAPLVTPEIITMGSRSPHTREDDNKNSYGRGEKATEGPLLAFHNALGSSTNNTIKRLSVYSVFLPFFSSSCVQSRRRMRGVLRIAQGQSHAL